MKSVVGLRAHGQRDPLHEYKSEGFTLFDKLLTDLREGVTKSMNRLLINVQMQRQESQAPQAAPQRAPTAQRPSARSPMDMMTGSAPVPAGNADVDFSTANVSRNSQCPCGSGKKFKHCHGKA